MTSPQKPTLVGTKIISRITIGASFKKASIDLVGFILSKWLSSATVEPLQVDDVDLVLLLVCSQCDFVRCINTFNVESDNRSDQGYKKLAEMFLTNLIRSSTSANESTRSRKGNNGTVNVGRG